MVRPQTMVCFEIKHANARMHLEQAGDHVDNPAAVPPWWAEKATEVVLKLWLCRGAYREKHPIEVIGSAIIDLVFGWTSPIYEGRRMCSDPHGTIVGYHFLGPKPDRKQLKSYENTQVRHVSVSTCPCRWKTTRHVAGLKPRDPLVEQTTSLFYYPAQKPKRLLTARDACNYTTRATL